MERRRPPYDVVVDGRRLSWEEFGRVLEPFEGWPFTLRFEDVPMIDPQEDEWETGGDRPGGSERDREG